MAPGDGRIEIDWQEVWHAYNVRSPISSPAPAMARAGRGIEINWEAVFRDDYARSPTSSPAPAMSRGDRRIDINWQELFRADDTCFPTSSSSPGREDVCFAALSPAPAAAAGSKRGRGVVMGTRCPQRRFEGLRRDPESLRRPVTRAAAAAKPFEVFAWGPQDEQGERASHKFCVKSPPVRRKMNYDQLDMKNERE
ncbi:hypothetical protein ACP4OV_008814 [Aristida adscensionis]